MNPESGGSTWKIGKAAVIVSNMLFGGRVRQ